MAISESKTKLSNGLHRGWIKEDFMYTVLLDIDVLLL